jgi:hypothetical protein
MYFITIQYPEQPKVSASSATTTFIYYLNYNYQKNNQVRPVKRTISYEKIYGTSNH